MAWDTVMEPAPMASTTRIGPQPVARPRPASIGATRDDVVMMATVEEPCAVFRAAAMTNGSAIPMPSMARVFPR